MHRQASKEQEVASREFGPDNQSFSRLRAQTRREGLRAAPCARTHTPAPDFLRKRTSAEPALPQRSARRSALLGSARRGAGNRKGGPLARRLRTQLAQGTGPGAPRTAASPGAGALLGAPGRRVTSGPPPGSSRPNPGPATLAAGARPALAADSRPGAQVTHTMPAAVTTHPGSGAET